MKKVFFVLILVAMIVQSVAPACAHDKADEHYEELELVLFGDRHYQPKLQDAAKAAITMIEKASALAIDQFGGTGQGLLQDLSDYGVQGLPESIDQIDFRPRFDKHRYYTHKGWDFPYTGQDDAKWPVRKNILRATAEKVFGLRFFSGTWLWVDFGYDDRCDSFCALVYYVHIIGDHIEANSKKTANPNYKASDIMVPLVRDNYDNRNNPDIIDDLIRHLEILFAEKPGNARVYGDLIDRLLELKSEAAVSVDITAGMSSNAYADKLLTILSDSVPILLRNEEFFKKVFYPDRIIN